MKKILLGLLMIASIKSQSQEITGRAIYEGKLSVGNIASKVEISKGVSDEIADALKKASEKKFVLEFTKDESIFKEDEELAKPVTTSNGGTVIMRTNGSGKTYKNLKDKIMLTENDILDKALIVKEDLENLGWELTTETKKIGNYTAYKATKKIEYTQIDTNESTTDLLSKINSAKSKDGLITAWYTPEIPVSNGPDRFGGLPGLILELHMPQMVYLCSEVILNPKKPINIKPLKGKEITSKEYEKLIKERFKGVSSIRINGEEIKSIR